MICLLTGDAGLWRMVTERSRSSAVDDEWRPVSLYQRLLVGSEIRTAGGAEVTLVFFDGRRYVVEASSRVVVKADGARVASGSVRTLPSVPALAEIPRLDQPGNRPSADRIRQHETDAVAASFRLYPRGASLLADDAILRFTPFAGAETYRVEIIDPQGEEVYTEETETTRIRVPVGRLVPGAVYYWRVSAKDRGLLGGAFFVTVSDEVAQARRRLIAQAARDDDPGLRLLAAEVDRGLGLRQEACRGLPDSAFEALGEEIRATLVERFGCEAEEQRFLQVGG